MLVEHLTVRFTKELVTSDCAVVLAVLTVGIYIPGTMLYYNYSERHAKGSVLYRKATSHDVYIGTRGMLVVRKY